ncbi:MAG TPA: hypothetical protein VGS22_28440 [Thermoanaerobaculia bacterium]|nr:hypothetical protein [Thermoanaerobaculia bacterium]
MPPLLRLGFPQLARPVVAGEKGNDGLAEFLGGLKLNPGDGTGTVGAVLGVRHPAKTPTQDGDDEIRLGDALGTGFNNPERAAGSEVLHHHRVPA